MKHPTVTLGIILFKGEKYLKKSLGSLMTQDYPHLEILLRDQSPHGEAYAYLEKEMPEVFKKAHVEKGGNLWHSGGHNALIRKMIRHTKGDSYYICASNDMLYPPDFVSEMVKAMEKPEHRHYGSATCRLLRWVFEGDSKTDTIDSLGIGLSHGHHFFDQGQGASERSAGHRKEIFGPSGALAMFRRKTLDEIGFKNEAGDTEYFDELLHYKNDVDLAYRMQWAGYDCLLVSDVKVYHDRQVDEKKHKSEWARGNSLLGHLITLQKNVDSRFSLRVRLSTALTRLARFLHTLLLHPRLIEQYKLVKKFAPEIRQKKKAMLKRRSPKAIEALMQ